MRPIVTRRIAGLVTVLFLHHAPARADSRNDLGPQALVPVQTANQSIPTLQQEERARVLEHRGRSYRTTGIVLIVVAGTALIVGLVSLEAGGYFSFENPMQRDSSYGKIAIACDLTAFAAALTGAASWRSGNAMIREAERVRSGAAGLLPPTRTVAWTWRF